MKNYQSHLATILFLTVSTLSGTAALASPINVFSTGASVTNGIDNNYTITSGPTTSPVVNGAGAASAFLTTTPGAKWVADKATSSWISPDADAQDHFGQYYTYQTTFSLAGLTAATAQLSGHFSVDDSLLVYLNGVQVFSAFGWTTTTNFAINSNFVSGLNTLDFVVDNSGSGPTGLNVAISGTASSSAVPEPAGVGLMGAGLISAVVFSRKAARGKAQKV